MKKLSIATIAAAILISFSAAAEQAPSFDFVSLNYLSNDTVVGSQAGFDIKANVSIMNGVFAETDLSRVTKSGNTMLGGDIGIGYGYAVLPSTALVVTAGLTHNRVSPKGLSTLKDSGQYATIGVRSRILHDDLELGLRVNRHWTNISETSYTASARYFVMDQFSVELGYDHVDSDFKAYTLGVAYHF
ncbi:MAG TPA: hypothetical protein VKY35_03040 [Aliidiomarina sp.]|nr:hypothetical protein [Aliidiomarina sp.]